VGGRQTRKWIVHQTQTRDFSGRTLILPSIAHLRGDSAGFHNGRSHIINLGSGEQFVIQCPPNVSGFIQCQCVLAAAPRIYSVDLWCLYSTINSLSYDLEPLGIRTSGLGLLITLSQLLLSTDTLPVSIYTAWNFRFPLKRRSDHLDLWPEICYEKRSSIKQVLRGVSHKFRR